MACKSFVSSHKSNTSPTNNVGDLASYGFTHGVSAIFPSRHFPKTAPRNIMRRGTRLTPCHHHHHRQLELSTRSRFPHPFNPGHLRCPTGTTWANDGLSAPCAMQYRYSCDVMIAVRGGVSTIGRDIPTQRSRFSRFESLFPPLSKAPSLPVPYFSPLPFGRFVHSRRRHRHRKKLATRI